MDIRPPQRMLLLSKKIGRGGKTPTTAMALKNGYVIVITRKLNKIVHVLMI